MSPHFPDSPANLHAAPRSEAPLLVPCPQCGTRSAFSPANPWRPFCSQRCKLIDMGAWASEDFRIAAEPPSDPQEP